TGLQLLLERVWQFGGSPGSRRELVRTCSEDAVHRHRAMPGHQLRLSLRIGLWLRHGGCFAGFGSQRAPHPPDGKSRATPGVKTRDGIRLAGQIADIWVEESIMYVRASQGLSGVPGIGQPAPPGFQISFACTGLAPAQVANALNRPTVNPIKLASDVRAA